ncbi:MAG: flagellar biosynthesis anti-sigma factor FlgM [Phycisphaerae bacterium]
MNDIHSVSGPATAQTLREYAQQSHGRLANESGIAPGDRVEISELASVLNRLADLPDERARRIVSIRNAIQQDTYVTGDKLDVTSDRLFKDL